MLLRLIATFRCSTRPRGTPQLAGFRAIRRGLLEEAAASFQRAVALEPCMVSYRLNLGSCLAELGRPADALQHLDVAIQLNPTNADAHKNRGMALLHLQEFEKGWQDYEWRWKCADALKAPFREPAWDGMCPGGCRILLYCEQGLGDTLQFVRFAALVKEKGGCVFLECPQGIDKNTPNVPRH